jgi:hypothetical protein
METSADQEPQTYPIDGAVREDPSQRGGHVVEPSFGHMPDNDSERLMGRAVMDFFFKGPCRRIPVGKVEGRLAGHLGVDLDLVLFQRDKIWTSQSSDGRETEERSESQNEQHTISVQLIYGSQAETTRKQRQLYQPVHHSDSKGAGE